MTPSPTDPAPPAAKTRAVVAVAPAAQPAVPTDAHAELRAESRTDLRADTPPVWTRQHLLGIEELSRGEILQILDTARVFADVSTRSVRKVPALNGKVVVLLFFEPSTRTRTSFELAARRLSADTIEFSETMSSTRKGESLIDTAKNIEAMGVDVMVVRHASSGAPWIVANHVECSIVNAGDGQHEHPTQALLDLYTLRERWGDAFAGKRVAFVGDIKHSRVARSNLWGLVKLGAHVHLVGPKTLVPAKLAEAHANVSIHHDLDEILPELDAINLLRIQMERQGAISFPSLREYHLLYGLTPERMRRAKSDVAVMHPGPMNRGVEISPEVADGPNSLILRQVTNGLAARMAVLYLVCGVGDAGSGSPSPTAS